MLKEGTPIKKKINVSYFLRVPFPNVIYRCCLIEDLLTIFFKLEKLEKSLIYIFKLPQSVGIIYLH